MYDNSKNEIIIIGDFNSDLLRLNRQDKELHKLINEMNLIAIDIEICNKPNYTYKNNNSKSWIDHVIIKKLNSKLVVQEIKIKNEEEDSKYNNSDHFPIITTIKFSRTYKKEGKTKTKYIKKPNWENKDFKKKYVENLNEEIDKSKIIEILNKTQYENKEDLDRVIESLNNSIKISIEMAMNKELRKKTIVKHTKSKTWWDKKLNKYKSKIKRITLKNNKNGIKRARYKNKIKELKYKFRKLQRQKIATEKAKQGLKLAKLERANKKKYWHEMKKIMKSNVRPELNIDEATKTFYDLFNTTINQSEENKLKNKNAKEKNVEYRNKINDIGTHKISLSTVEGIIKNLRNGKANGNSEISNEAIKYSNNTKVLILVRGILEKIINYGFIPKHFNIGVIHPIIKNANGDLKSSNNIRPITVSDVLCNIFERYVLKHIENSHIEPAQQFGFKANSSCQHALYVFKETIQHYTTRKKPVYVSLIDASKAFDKINREVLFNKLINILDNHTWRALYEYYNNSYSYAMLGEEKGETFKTTIGVKQGGPLSPKLFSIYVEELIYKLKDIDGLCKIGENSCGVIMYADDLTILSETTSSLNNALEVCNTYGDTNDIKYNPDKTVYMIYGTSKQRNDEPIIRMGDERLNKVKKAKLLGREFEDSGKDEAHIDTRCTKAMKCFFSLEKAGIKSKKAPYKYKSNLFKIFCRPILHYGGESIKMTQKIRKRMSTVEGGIVKRIFNLPNRQRHTKLMAACKIEPTNTYINKARLKFVLRLIENKLTKGILKYQLEEIKKQKKGLILEITKIIGKEIKTIDDLHFEILLKLSEINNETNTLKKTDEVVQIKACLERPNKTNTKALRELTRPEAFNKIQTNQNR